MRSDVLRDPRLSDGAVRLYWLLIDHAFGTTESWPGEVRLAQILGRDERTIRRHLHELEDAGHISSRRVGRRNHYTLNTLAPCGAAETDLVQHRTKMSGIPDQHRTPVSGQHRTKMSDESLLEEELPSSSAAAADQKRKTETKSTADEAQVGATADGLKRAGVPLGLAKRLAARNPALAAAVAAWLPVRLSRPKGGPITSIAGFVCDVFNDPGKYEFRQDDSGAWHPPRETQAVGRPSPEQEAAEKARRNEQWLQHQREAEEARKLNSSGFVQRAIAEARAKRQ
jgi:DNA-binding transcriptional ArsR family regulator